MAERTPEDLVAAYVDLVEAEWVRGGLEPRVRHRLCADLERDLLGALADGAPATEVLARDPRLLARDIAAAEGESLFVEADADVTLGGLVGRGVGAAAVMAAVVWFLALPRLVSVVDNESTPILLAISLVVTYVPCAALVLGGAGLAMGLYLRRLRGWRSTTARSTGLMAALGGLGVVVCATIGARSDDDSALGVLALYVAIVGGLAAAGIALAWRWAGPERVVFERVFE